VGKQFQIAIDGPVGAGKSTVAKMVAERLGIVYIDTGAMYRAVALEAKRREISWTNEKKVGELVSEIEIKLIKPSEGEKDGRNVTVLLNGEDVSWEVRAPDMGEGASVVSQYQQVRKGLVRLQRRMAIGQKVIMEGRDIGTKVLPDAELKIYLDAERGERARRKQVQLSSKGEKVSFLEAEKDVKTRDEREMRRKIDPLRPAEGAWMLDTTGLSISQVVDRIVQRVAQLS